MKPIFPLVAIQCCVTCSLIPATNPPSSRRPLNSYSNANLMCLCPFQLVQANLYAIRFVWLFVPDTNNAAFNLTQKRSDFRIARLLFQFQFYSSCFDLQLPAMVHSGMAIVISPLLALIKDQVNALRARQVPCETINSSIPEAEKKRIRAVILRIKSLFLWFF